MSNCSANHHLNIWLGLFVFNSLRINLLLTYCLIFKVLYFVASLFYQGLFVLSTFFWIFVNMLSFQQVLLYHLKTTLVNNFFKSFVGVLSLSQGQVLLYQVYFLSSTLFLIFFSLIFTYFFIHISTFLYIFKFQTSMEFHYILSTYTLYLFTYFLFIYFWIKNDL